MSLPPEHIVLKRRRGSEAIDYLQEQRNKRIHTDYHWARVDDRCPESGLIVAPLSPKSPGRRPILAPTSDPYLPEVPIIQSMLSDTVDRPLVPKAKTSHDDVTRTPLVARSPSSLEVISGNKQAAPLERTRQFHLVKNSFLSPSQVGAGHGIQKRKYKGRVGLALFTERRVFGTQRRANSLVSRQTVAAGEQQSEKPAVADCASVKSGARTYKRPSAAAEEVKWRTRTWNKPAADGQNRGPATENAKMAEANRYCYENHSLELAMQLEELALQAIEERAEPPMAIKQTPPLKFQPKPPKPRPQKSPMSVEESDMGDILMNEDEAGGDEGEFVYDTYVRSEGPLKEALDDDAASSNHISQIVPSRAYGLLVIDREDEEAWEMFAEDIESDKEWDTDEEDENAEDYYGNDYPEDELESDDEFDRDAYKYRKGASEYEELEVVSDIQSGDDAERD